MQFCREMLRLRGRDMSMLEVAQWMVSQAISMVNDAGSASIHIGQQQGPSDNTNPSIKVDLRRYLRPDHPELDRRGISAETCHYLGCGFLPQRSWAKTASPLNSRLVFQIRGLRENGHGLQPVILSHVGRALSREQEDTHGKYWSYPFRKGWELYNQDQILLDQEAWRQANKFGVILVEGFFDVAKLVEAGCRNVVALMGSTISTEQVERLVWIRTLVRCPRILLFLDRDQAGQSGCRQVQERLQHHDLDVEVFEWDQLRPWPGKTTVQDPADMSVEQIQALRGQGIL